MSRTACVVVAAVVLAVAGCGDEAPTAAPGGQGLPDGGAGPSSAVPQGPLRGASMASLNGDSVCGLIPKQVIESTVGVTVDEEVGREYGQPGDALSHNLSCVYPFADGQVDTWLSANVQEKTDTQLVDELFASPTGDPTQYEEVPDLGLAAGFGAHPDKGLDQNLLAVVVPAGNGRLMVKLNLNPKDQAGLEQLRPIAEAAVDGLQQALE